jgi:hypothetical protein
MKPLILHPAKIALSILCFVIMTILAHGQLQFWGTSSQGGTNNCGFIFKTDSIGNNLEIIHQFQTAIDGENLSALLLASNDKLYGLASAGGVNATGVFNGGTLFEYDLATNQFNVLQHFGPSNTALPNIYTPRAEGRAALTEVSPGVLYGLMQQGDFVFSYNINTGVFTKPFTIPTYNGGAMNGVLRNRLNAAFIKAADGMLYTSTSTNSNCPIPNPYLGSIIRVNPLNNTLTIIHKNNCVITDGYSYNGSMIEVNGKFYGTANYGGVNYRGVIYEFNTTGNVYTKKYDFNGGPSSYEPTSLVYASNSKLYGTAHGGGVSEPNLPNGGGVLYEFDLTTNTFTKKYDFLQNQNWLGDMGTFPQGLINSKNGKIYGVTQFGVFEYNVNTNAIRKAGRFWAQGFNASIVQVCRKPFYTSQPVTTFEVCKGTAFELDLENTNATTITWKHNNIVDPTQTNTELNVAYFTEADAGTWQCSMENECGNTVVPAIELTIVNTTPIITLTGSTLQTTNSGMYQWIDCENNNLPIVGATSNIFTLVTSGKYAVIVDNVCKDTSACLTVELTTTAITEQLSANSVRLYPNPVDNELNVITTDGVIITSVIIHNSVGQEIQKSFSEKTNVSTLAPGIYYITVETNKGVWREKFVKR